MRAQKNKELFSGPGFCRPSVSLLCAAALCLCASLFPRPLAAQEENKVIIRGFDWGVYATRHFDIHYYGESAPWLPFAAGTLEKAYKKAAADLNPALDKRIPFFLYASINDMQQNNIADVGDGVGGLTEPYKDRFMAWSDGSKGWLEDVITHEFAHEAQFSVLIDGFWKSARILKTFIYPLWMMEGMAEYETGSADLALETMYARDAVLSPGGLIPLVRLGQFAHLKPHQITLGYKTGGQAIRFLAEQYGRDKPAKMLELFKSRYDVSAVLMPLIGLDLYAFDGKFREYSELKYLADARENSLGEPSRFGERLTVETDDIPEFNVSPVLSPDGGELAYLSTMEGHPPVLVIKDLSSGKAGKTVILRDLSDAENIPYGRFSKPLKSLSWSGDGGYLAFSGQKNHREYLFLYDLEEEEFIRLAFPDFMEVRQPVFSPDSSKLMFVGMRGGFNDLYEVALTTAVLDEEPVPLSALRRLTDSPGDESSPAYLPDGSGAVYSCETEIAGVPRRELCRAGFSGGVTTPARMPGGDIYDPVVSPDGRKVLFVSDAEGRFELYELDLASAAVSRLTRVIGGNFNPAYSPDGKKILFSSFRGGSMNVYAGAAENFLREPYVPVLPPAEPSYSAPALSTGAPKEFEVADSSGTFRPYKFKASTDLFYPVFMFSSPGGLFLMNYWQGSDMLGNHNAAALVNYNSASDYLSYQVNYSYAKYRMPLLLQTSGLSIGNALNEQDLEFDRKDRRFAAGTAYPFDRYNRLEFLFIRKDVSDKFEVGGETDHARTRAAEVAFVQDYVNGLYLTAVRGSRTELSYTSAGSALDGNELYGAGVFQRLQYVPLSKRSAFADRFLAGKSVGRNRKNFDFGGLGGVRGFSSSSPRESASKVLMNNFEVRTPLFRDLNYYMWFMFPDFYFKTVYVKLFFDSAYGWDRGSQLRNFRSGDIQSSAGAGIDIHTFILQAFQLVLSFDYAVRTSDGGRIFYFYLGPMF
jgi:Tol biopolymer transport system component